MGLSTGTNLSVSVLLLLLSSLQSAASYTMEPRWGHALAYLPSPPTLLIQGGKTSQSGQTYTSTPNSGDTIILPLNTSFSTSSPPFNHITSSGTTSVWHTLSPLVSTADMWSILTFGGDGGSTEAVQTASDSAGEIDLDLNTATASFTQEVNDWASQPQRRIYHSSASLISGGKTYITGGLKDDGSGKSFSEVYLFDPSVSPPAFTVLPSLPVGLYHHISALLPNGTLIVLGGVYLSNTTGTATLLPLSALYTLDLTVTFLEWVPRAIGGLAPSGRRGAAAALNQAGDKLWCQGGADATITTTYGDTWILDLVNLGWTQVSNLIDGPSARFDHKAASVGDDQILLVGGYGTASPADAGLYIFDMGSSSYVTSFSPSSPTTTVTTYQSGTSVVANTLSPSASLPVPTSARTDPLSANDRVSDSRSPPDSTLTISASHIASPSGGLNDSSSASGTLTAGARFGLIFGILGGGLMLLAGLLLCLRKRRRDKRARAANWPQGRAKARSLILPYDGGEKGGERLLETSKGVYGGPGVWHDRTKPDTQPPHGDEGGSDNTFGMGSIGAKLSAMAGNFGGRPVQGTKGGYAELNEHTGGPLRQPTRRVGSGIRLVGPRPQPPGKPAFSPTRETSGMTGQRSSRFDMLGDEDSRPFQDIVEGDEGEEEDDWHIGENGGRDWKSARSLLGDQAGTGEDGLSLSEDDDCVVRVPIKGGPVPTPPISVRYMDPFTDQDRSPSGGIAADRNSAPTSEPLSLDGLLLPPRPSNARHNARDSLPLSHRSRFSIYSLSGSDHSEGVIQHAQLATALTASVISPSKIEKQQEHLHRSESLLSRMTGGLLGNNLGSFEAKRKPSSVYGNSFPQDLDIRDPAPLPTLWPITSRDDLIAVRNPSDSHPPSSFVPPFANSQTFSTTSVTSARSMRDMMVVQRESTDESRPATIVSGLDFGDIGQLGTMIDFDNGNLYGEGELGKKIPRLIVNTEKIEDSDGPIADSQGASQEIQIRDGDFSSLSPFEDPPDLTLRVPKEISMLADKEATLPRQQLSGQDQATNLEPDLHHVEAAHETEEQALLAGPSCPLSAASLHAPSPVAPPSPAQAQAKGRRPVREVVNSINKRASANPTSLSLFSPITYSPTPSAPPSPNRTLPPTGSTGIKLKKTNLTKKTYEAVRKSPLTVANPDKKGRSSSGTGSE